MVTTIDLFRFLLIIHCTGGFFYIVSRIFLALDVDLTKQKLLEIILVGCFAWELRLMYLAGRGVVRFWNALPDSKADLKS